MKNAVMFSLGVVVGYASACWVRNRYELVRKFND